MICCGCPASLPVENIPGQAEQRSGVGRKVFGFSPESCSGCPGIRRWAIGWAVFRCRDVGIGSRRPPPLGHFRSRSKSPVSLLAVTSDAFSLSWTCRSQIRLSRCFTNLRQSRRAHHVRIPSVHSSGHRKKRPSFAERMAAASTEGRDRFRT